MLNNDVISIISLEEKHLEQLRLLRNHPDTWYFLTSTSPINQKAQIAWFEGLSKDRTKMYFAIEMKGKFVGMVRMDEWDMVNQSIRVGVDIVPEYRRKGIATMAYKLILDYLFKHLNIHRVWLLVVEFNKPVIDLYQKLGFKKEGAQREALFRDGKWNDYIMMSILREEYERKRGK